MPKRSITKIILSLVLVIFIGIIISVSFFSKPIIEHILHRAGFADARIGASHVTLSGTNLKNVTVAGSTVGGIELYATVQDLLSLHLGRVVVSDVHIQWPLPASSGTAGGPLNLFTRNIEFKNAGLTLPTAYGDLPLVLNGALIDRGADYQVNATFDATASFVEASGQMTATIDKQTRKIEAHVDIAEAKTMLPSLDMKRITGWIEAVITPGNALPDITAQLTAGATRLYGVPFQGMTLAASPAEFVLNGQVIDNGGDISAEIKLDTADAALDRFALTMQANLKNLDTFGLEKLKGQGRFALAVKAEKEKTAPWSSVAQWKNLAGTAELSAKKLSLPGLVDRAEAAAKLTLALDPATRQLFIKTSGASYSDALVGIKDGTADLTLYMTDKPVVEGKIILGEIAQKSNPAYIVPVKLTLQFQPMNSIQSGTGFSGGITEKNGLLTAKIQGKHDSDTGAGNMTVNMPPVTLMKEIHSLKELFPASEQYVQNGTGTIGMTANVSWSKKGVSSSGELFLKNFTGTVQENEISDVNTVLKLENLMPLAFDHQQISVGALNVGLPLTNGVVEASLDEKRVFSLHRAEWELAKGHISSGAFSLPLDDISTDVTLTATKLDLPELFKIAPMEGLDATGTVNGTLPLEIRKGTVTLNNGVLETEGSGFIRYNPQEPPAFLKDPANKQIADLRVALQAFAFENLKITLSGEAGKDQKISLQIKGKNPDFYDGHSVALNLNVEGPLQNVLKYKPGGSQIPDSIKKQLEEYEKNHAKQ